VVVIGCGAIGLPLAVALASVGKRVLGVDSDGAKVAGLCAGRSELVDAGLAPSLREALADGRLAFAAALGAADRAPTYVIAVPTPSAPDGAFDKASLERALAAIGGIARQGDLVCIRSTLPMGATRTLAAAFGGLGLGFAACPDRSIAGAAYEEQFTVPHIVGGLDEDSGARAETLFSSLGAVIRAPDPETAEAIKLFANVQRDVTFALANQFALICEATGVDFAAVRQAGARAFPRFALARPGPVGGPCLTKDLALLLASGGVGDVDTGLLRAARALNESLADKLARAIEATLAGRPRSAAAVAILGLAFKGRPPTADQRGAFAAALAERLPGIEVRRWDPVSDAPAGRRAAVEGAAVVVLANDHPYLAIGLEAELRPDAVVFDVTGLIDPDPGFGFDVRRLGAGRR
jgi:nucleotide sugar dehydrogenase